MPEIVAENVGFAEVFAEDVVCEGGDDAVEGARES